MTGLSGDGQAAGLSALTDPHRPTLNMKTVLSVVNPRDMLARVALLDGISKPGSFSRSE